MLCLRFGLKRVVLVGDRGMITTARPERGDPVELDAQQRPSR
jgi:hypothetical protein